MELTDCIPGVCLCVSKLAIYRSDLLNTQGFIHTDMLSTSGKLFHTEHAQ